MTKDDITRMARDSGMELYGLAKDHEKFIHHLNEFAALVVAAERWKVAKWMIERSYATGHGDTIEDLLAELDWQIAERIVIEREACAKVAEQTVCDKHIPTGIHIYGTAAARAIRARGQNV